MHASFTFDVNGFCSDVLSISNEVVELQVGAATK